VAALAREVPTGDLPDVTRALSREVACNRPGQEDRDGKFLDYIALIMKVTSARLGADSEKVEPRNEANGFVRVPSAGLGPLVSRTRALRLIPFMAVSVRILFPSHDRCWSVGSRPYSAFLRLARLRAWFKADRTSQPRTLRDGMNARDASFDP
jgi:hypothetical protein